MICLMLSYTCLQWNQCNISQEAGKKVSSLTPVTPSNPHDGNVFCVWVTWFTASSSVSEELQQPQPHFLSRHLFSSLYQPLHHASPCVCSHMINYTGEMIHSEKQTNNNRNFFPFSSPSRSSHQRGSPCHRANSSTSTTKGEEAGDRDKTKNEQLGVEQGALLPPARAPLCSSSLIWHWFQCQTTAGALGKAPLVFWQ